MTSTVTTQAELDQAPVRAAVSGQASYRPVMRDPDLALFQHYDDENAEDRPPPFVGWDIENWCRLGVYDGEDGLHVTVSTRDRDYTRSVTVEQVRLLAQHLVRFADAVDKGRS